MRKMMKWALIGSAALAVAGPASAEWVEATSKHFVIVGDMSEDQATEYARRLERFDQMLRMITHVPDDSTSPSTRVMVYLLPGLSDVRSLAGRRSVGGFYSGSAQDFHAVMPRTTPAELDLSPQHVLFHEYTHHILLNNTTATYPGWIHEGLAEFFGTALPKDDGSLLIGSPPQLRGWALHQQYQMSAKELLTSDSRKLSDEENEHKYSRGWLLVHYLLLGGSRAGQLDQYLKLVRQGTPSLEAGQQAFGDLGKLDRELNVYNKSARFPGVSVTADKLQVGPVTTRALRPCEADIMPTRIKSAVGVNEKTAPLLVPPARRVASKCVNDPFVQRALAEIEFDAKNNDAAMSAADRALAIEPGNIMAMIYKGRVYARQSKWADARKWLIKANRADPEYALPLELYYDSFVRAGQPPSKVALDGLLRAVVLVPQDSALRMRVGRAMLVEGDVKTARIALAPVAFSPHADHDTPAYKIVKMIDDKAPAAAMLAEAEKAKWNELGNE